MAKKQKTLTPKRVPKSKIFSPFRTIGLVTNNTPCCVSTLGQSYVVNTVVGKSVQQYDAATLRLLYMTQPQTTNEIERICSHFHFLFAVNGQELVVYKRGRAVAKAEILNKPLKEKCREIITFGEFVCLVYSKSLEVFKFDQKNLNSYTSVQLPSILGDLVSISHPATYLNKVVLATKSCLVLVNVKTGRVVYTFQDMLGTIVGIESCPVVLDVVAVYMATGDIHFLDLSGDKIMFSLKTNERISCLSFRSDIGEGSAPLLGVGTNNGDVLFYDLNMKRRVQSMRSFSNGPVSNLEFVPGQAICIAQGSDNVLSELVFDPPVSNQSAGSHRARLLRRRGGHGAPPTSLLFADSESHLVFSASTDGSLWAFSLRKDSQNRRFGGVNHADLPPVTGLAYSMEKRERWGTLVTIHKGSHVARTWSSDKFALEEHQLSTCDSTIAKSVAVSSCGNFALLGSAGGSISVYNLQSGILRSKLVTCHKAAITGLEITTNNSTVISASLDGHLNFSTLNGVVIKSVDIDQGSLQSLKFNHNSGLVGVSTDSGSIVLVDIKTFKVVREFWGHTGRILDFDFFPNGRRLISTGLDGTLRTWDVFSGLCVDAVRIKNPATHLKISYDGEWIASAHVRGIGIQMWSVKSVFTELRAVNDVVDIDMPEVTGENGTSLLENALQNNGNDNDDENDNDDANENEDVVVANGGKYDEVENLYPNLATLSGQQRVKFTTLVNLDVIRERNKPEKAPEKPKRAPFFLTAGSNNEETEMDVDDELAELKPVDGNFSSESKVSKLLASQSYIELGKHLASLGPAATDLEIRSLDSLTDEGEILGFINCLTTLVEEGTDFELVQAWCSMLFKAHGPELQEPQFQEALKKFEATESQRVHELQDRVRACSGIIQFLRRV